MKKFTGIILSLCVLLTATACNADKVGESTSETSSQTTSATQNEDTSKTEVTVQTEQTEDVAPRPFRRKQM